MIDANNVTTHFNQLCDFGGRLCGTDSEKNALNYVSSYLSSLSQGTVHIHPVEYPGWKCDDSHIIIDTLQYEAVPLPGCASLAGDGVDLEIVDAGRGTPDELQSLADKIKGRAVLVTHEYMFAADHVHRSRKLEMAESLGAAVFIIANPWEDSGMISGDASSGLPAFGVSKKTADALRVAAKQSKRAHFRLDSRSQVSTTQTIDWYLRANDECSKKTDKEIIICAHVDGHVISESALDNASGVAVVLALADQYLQQDCRPCDIRILIFSAEERGLIGSENYVASLAEIQKQRIIGVVNLDCVAGSKKLCAMTSGFESLKTVVAKCSKETGRHIDIFEPLVPNSDHFNFAVEGIPALRLIAGFGEQNSKLRHVLTSADKRALVTKSELESALNASKAILKIMENSK